MTYSRNPCSEVDTTNTNYDNILHKLCCSYVKNPCVRVRSYSTATFSSVIHHKLSDFCWHRTSDVPTVPLFLIQSFCVAGATSSSVFPSLVLTWTSTTEQNRAAPIWWISLKQARWILIAAQAAALPPPHCATEAIWSQNAVVLKGGWCSILSAGY